MPESNWMIDEDVWAPFVPSTEQPWSRRLAAHLLRRAGFAGSIPEIATAVEQGLPATLDQCFDVGSAEAYEQSMQTAGRLVSSGPDARGLSAWWLLRMIQTPCPLQEQVTLFWHNHFATGAEKVQHARSMFEQNGLFRSRGLGPFGDLVREISRDPAMLVYLDSSENRKTRPNENFARELLELFCLGPGNYTETDIKELARCFTGYEVKRHEFHFNPYQHDGGTKRVFDQSGKWSGDEAIEWVVQQPACARFLAKKLIRFFMFEDRPVSDDLAEPIAQSLRDSGFDIHHTLRRMLGSRLFFSTAVIGAKIKSPVELVIGFLRGFQASTNMQQLASRLERLGQLPLFPPNVKGWEGGKTWINASTILARSNLLTEGLTNGQFRFQAGTVDQWVRDHARFGVDDSMTWVNDYLLAVPLDEEALASLRQPFRESPAAALAGLAALPQFQLN